MTECADCRLPPVPLRERAGRTHTDVNLGHPLFGGDGRAYPAES